MNRISLTARRGILAANIVYVPRGVAHEDRRLDYHDLLYILEGNWELFEEGRRLELMPGDLALLMAGRRHYGVNPCRDGTRVIYVHMEALPGDGSAEGGDALDDALGIAAHVHCGGMPLVRTLLEDIVSTFWSDDRNRMPRLHALGDLLLCELSDASSRKNARDTTITRAISSIKMAPERFWSIGELAEQAHVSPRTLTAHFKRVTGRTVHQYQMELKLRMAALEVKNRPDRSLEGIAEELGFCSAFHLSRCFRKTYDCPPSALRRKE